MQTFIHQLLAFVSQSIPQFFILATANLILPIPLVPPQELHLKNCSPYEEEHFSQEDLSTVVKNYLANNKFAVTINSSNLQKYIRFVIKKQNRIINMI